MALFVDLDEEAEPPQTHHYGLKPQWNGERIQQQLQQLSSGAEGTAPAKNEEGQSQPNIIDREPENLNEHNGMAEALGCYPIVMAIASSIDLNTLDNLSKTCRQVRQALLQYRSVVLAHTLHCAYEDVPIDPEATFRYRALAWNLFGTEDGRIGDPSGKSGSCARDMVAECRRCGTVVCRNCTIKQPSRSMLRDRHRRLCVPCSKAPLGSLVKPQLRADTTADADEMRLAICTCDSEGVWLCQPCGKSIRGADHDYKSIWKWRNLYGEVLGGLGTGIGEGDRGVICGREAACCGSKEREQETDCDAADAREQDEINSNFGNGNGSLSPWTTPSPASSVTGSPPGERRTPSPQLRPGYARHEIEGIGGVVKTKLMRMVRVGACVPEWEDEKKKGEILGREVRGESRSWCGWCWRVIPGKKDWEGVVVKAGEGERGDMGKGKGKMKMVGEEDRE
ncbi:uncharacterized protein GGS22DRAFT_196283 [Annulohypoxylon maeteangense]|uniref:uncharacterized protein n=1 Tax=Annulohypoxylon maeteangense TaxID=1927788 RepID=UPI002007C6BC|nr:uncharacterized protein GGS22DRAFT_196283 [Annulohypoxylon maeteangense]KAI0881732.1 hypothetical protein GGS22DRAFT_196283 [Annulohypoxylon maeteangense]